MHYLGAPVDLQVSVGLPVCTELTRLLFLEATIVLFTKMNLLEQNAFKLAHLDLKILPLFLFSLFLAGLRVELCDILKIPLHHLQSRTREKIYSIHTWNGFNKKQK